MGTKLHLSKAKGMFYLCYFLCFIYSIFTYYWSDLGISVIAGSINLFFGLVTFLLAEYCFKYNPDSFITANRILIISLLIQLALSMFFGVELKPADLETEYNDFYSFKVTATTLLGDSNYIAFFFGFGLLYEFIAKEKGWILFVISNLLGIMLTISRGAIISIACAFFVYLYIMLLNSKVKMITKLIIFCNSILLLGSFFFFFQYTEVGITFWNGLLLGLGDSSMNSRQYLWDEAITQITLQPFGIGIVTVNIPHNVILTSIRSLGVLFGTIYLLLLSFPVFYLLKCSISHLSNKGLAALIAYLSVFIHSMVEVFFFDTESIIWSAIIISFIFANSQQLVNQANKDENCQCLNSL
jgi:hypothetical protein